MMNSFPLPWLSICIFLCKYSSMTSLYAALTFLDTTASYIYFSICYSFALVLDNTV